MPENVTDRIMRLRPTATAIMTDRGEVRVDEGDHTCYCPPDLFDALSDFDTETILHAMLYGIER